jgi:hypothetical protein
MFYLLAPASCDGVILTAPVTPKALTNPRQFPISSVTTRGSGGRQRLAGAFPVSGFLPEKLFEFSILAG